MKVFSPITQNESLINRADIVFRDINKKKLNDDENDMRDTFILKFD